MTGEISARVGASIRKRGIRLLCVGCLLLATFGPLLPAAAATTSPRRISALLERVVLEEMSGSRLRTVRVEEVAAGDPRIVLKLVKQYGKHGNRGVRHFVYTVYWLIGVQNTDAQLRRQVVDKLADACADSGNGRWASEHLLSFGVSDFTGEARQSIRAVLAKDKPSYHFVLLAGVAGLHDQAPALRELLIDEARHREEYKKNSGGGLWYRTAGWCARLALARLGSKEDTAHCIQMIESETDVDVVGATLQHHLAYMRRPETVPAFRRLLESDERLSPTNEGFPGAELNGYTMDILTRILKGFPVRPKEPEFACGGYSDEEIAKALEWLRSRERFEFQEVTRYRPIM
jgi:hypothetical protein